MKFSEKFLEKIEKYQINLGKIKEYEKKIVRENQQLGIFSLNSNPRTDRGREFYETKRKLQQENRQIAFDFSIYLQENNREEFEEIRRLKGNDIIGGDGGYENKALSLIEEIRKIFEQDSQNVFQESKKDENSFLGLGTKKVFNKKAFDFVITSLLIEARKKETTYNIKRLFLTGLTAYGTGCGVGYYRGSTSTTLNGMNQNLATTSNPAFLVNYQNELVSYNGTHSWKLDQWREREREMIIHQR